MWIMKVWHGVNKAGVHVNYEGVAWYKQGWCPCGL